MQVFDLPRTGQFLTRFLSSAHASITEDGEKLAVSNMVSGFDVYATATGMSLATLTHAVGSLYAVPVLFAHGGNAIIGGSTVGKVHLWDVHTGCEFQELVLQGTGLNLYR